MMAAGAWVSKGIMQSWFSKVFEGWWMACAWADKAPRRYYLVNGYIKMRIKLHGRPVYAYARLISFYNGTNLCGRCNPQERREQVGVGAPAHRGSLLPYSERFPLVLEYPGERWLLFLPSVCLQMYKIHSFTSIHIRVLYYWVVVSFPNNQGILCRGNSFCINIFVPVLHPNGC